MAQSVARERRTRAEQMLETRTLIVEAAVHLHTTLGPARTNVSTIAARAGVQRHTVYAHFPEMVDLFRACSGLWAERNPFPDITRWAAIENPMKRLAVALDEVYDYWERTDADLAAILPGSERLPEMAEPLQAWKDGLTHAARALAAGWPSVEERGRCTRAAIAHALGLETWRSLVAEPGLSRSEGIALMCALVEAAASTDQCAPDLVP